MNLTTCKSISINGKDVSAISVGGKSVWTKAVTPAYVTYDYCTLDDTTYIDLGLVPTCDTTFEFTLRNMTAGKNLGIMGCRDTNSRCCWLFTEGSGGKVSFGFLNGTSGEKRLTLSDTEIGTTDKVYKLDWYDDSTLYFYDDGVSAGSFALSTLTLNKTILFGNCWNRAALLGYSPYDFREFKWWKSKVLVGDYVPAIKNDVAGLVNKVDDTFIAPAVGTAICGNYVTWDDGYTWVDKSFPNTQISSDYSISSYLPVKEGTLSVAFSSDGDTTNGSDTGVGTAIVEYTGDKTYIDYWKSGNYNGYNSTYNLRQVTLTGKGSTSYIRFDCKTALKENIFIYDVTHKEYIYKGSNVTVDLSDI